MQSQQREQKCIKKLTASLFSRQSCKGELLKLAGSLLLVYRGDVPELVEGVKTMLGWCDVALNDNAKNQQVCTERFFLCFEWFCRLHTDTMLYPV